MYRLALLFIFYIISIIPCSASGEDLKNCKRSSRKSKFILEEYEPDLIIREGLVSRNKQTIEVRRNNKVVAKIKLGKPVMVVQAEEEEKWGFFQFPQIGRTEDGNLFIGWQMKEDSHKTYGKGGGGSMISRDEGLSWESSDKNYFIIGRYGIENKNAEVLQVITPTTKDIKDYPSFPDSVNEKTINGYNFYLESEVPDEFKGTYLKLTDKKIWKSQIIHATINDPGLLRYTINGQMPVVWWGNIRELSGGAVVAGVYPSFYQNSKREVLTSAASFYKSEDFGRHWDLIGKIPCQRNGEGYESNLFDGREGFTEPTYEILNDSTFLCVLRTGSTTPMYKSFSTDKGKTWSTPTPFTPNGVMPNLILLGNGTLVLSSGRPGVQLRFCLEGDGKVWTEPIDLLPFMDMEGRFDAFSTSCGYTHIMIVDNKTFYIVYSDFKSKNDKGDFRKAIMFRKVEIDKVNK